jgi:hypothetical protein
VNTTLPANVMHMYLADVLKYPHFETGEEIEARKVTP